MITLFLSQGDFYATASDVSGILLDRIVTGNCRSHHGQRCDIRNIRSAGWLVAKALGGRSGGTSEGAKRTLAFLSANSTRCFRAYER